jgi:hypothetical protein
MAQIGMFMAPLCVVVRSLEPRAVAGGDAASSATGLEMS